MRRRRYLQLCLAGILMLTAYRALISAQRSTARAAVQSNQVADSIARAEALEKVGFYKEAETQLFGVFPVATASQRNEIGVVLARLRLAEENAEAMLADQESTKYLNSGEDLEKNGHLDEAVAAFKKAHELSRGPTARDNALSSLERVLTKKETWAETYIKAWTIPTFIKFVLGVLGAVALYLLVTFVFRILKSLGRVIARNSSFVEIGEFADATQTGFGKAFPEILQTVYQEYDPETSGNTQRAGVTPLLLYPGAPAVLPVLGSSKYEKFEALDLRIAGVDVAAFLSKVQRLIRQPRFTVAGAIYQTGPEIRSIAILKRYDRLMRRWDSAISGGQAGPHPASLAHRIIGQMFSDWHA